MSTHIHISWDDLQIQVPGTVAFYVDKAIKNTEELPDGVDRTAVVVAMIAASAAEFRTAALVVASQNIATAIEALADKHSEAISDMGREISNAVDTIADTLGK
jgi:hypothetical protein